MNVPTCVHMEDRSVTLARDDIVPGKHSKTCEAFTMKDRPSIGLTNPRKHAVNPRQQCHSLYFELDTVQTLFQVYRLVCGVVSGQVDKIGSVQTDVKCHLL